MSARFWRGLDRAIGAYRSGKNAPKSPLSACKITARSTMLRSKVMTDLLKKIFEKIDFCEFEPKKSRAKKMSGFFGGVRIELLGRIGAEKTRQSLLFPPVKLQLAQLCFVQKL